MAERDEFRLHIDALHYPYADESANPAYGIFLGS